ncbi:hypothetical protein HanRHA438_Chr14g0655271 [Helianthus annuus]|nr:hypothetical protein HanRHA438_Chr14g0655271 [Helianthus annuus]
MKAGGARHAVLEEIITKVDVVIRLAEEQWGWKMTNFIHGPYQLFLDANSLLHVVGYYIDWPLSVNEHGH